MTAGSAGKKPDQPAERREDAAVVEARLLEARLLEVVALQVGVKVLEAKALEVGVKVPEVKVPEVKVPEVKVPEVAGKVLEFAVAEVAEIVKQPWNRTGRFRKLHVQDLPRREARARLMQSSRKYWHAVSAGFSSIKSNAKSHRQ